MLDFEASDSPHITLRKKMWMNQWMNEDGVWWTIMGNDEMISGQHSTCIAQDK
jgi:hypothetical protein